MADGADSHRVSQPLQGVILCCTSIPTEQRTALASRAEQMGAVHKLDLTSDVTHLIVGDTDTPKYKYVAKERPDVRVLTPQWVEAVRQLWMHGEDPDVHALEKKHRLPPLAGLRICLTGFEDPIQRQKLQDLISGNGAEYHGDLTKAVTHLVALEPEGKKYTYAHLWTIRIVSVEWLHDSVERGMVLEEGLYNPLMPPAERGKNAWVRKDMSAVQLGKRSREEPQPGDAFQAEARGRRKLRRTASSKLEQRNSGIWNDIVGGGGFTPTEGASSELETRQTGQQTAGNSAAILASEGLLGGASNIRLESIPTYAESESDSYPNLLASKAQSSQSTFLGYRFYIHGFESKKARILREHISSHGGELLSLTDLTESMHGSGRDLDRVFLVLPHDSRSASKSDLPALGERFMLVTEWWIERCLHRKAFVDPKNNLTNQPFLRFPLDGFDDMTICSTGFDGLDLMHLSKTVRLMGATYDEYLSPSADALIWNAKSQPREKLRHAIEWGVPVVSETWLWDSIRCGRMESLEAYIIAVPQDNNLLANVSSLKTTHTLDVLAAGKSTACETVKKESPKRAESVAGEPSSSSQQAIPPARQHKTRTPSDLNKPLSLVEDSYLGIDLADTTENLSMSYHAEETAESAPEMCADTGREMRSNSGTVPDLSKVKSTAEQASSRRPPEEISTSIANLLAHAISTTNNNPSRDIITTKLNQTAEQTSFTGRRPPSRLLGRANSNTSARSASFSRASSIDSTSTTTGHNVNGIANGGTAAPVASQKVVYDDPDVQEQRERVLRKMGGKADVAGVVARTRSIGVAMDVGGVGTRTRLRTAK